MKVFGLNVNTSPKDAQFCLRGGDVYDPKIIGPDAFHPPWPTEYSRWYCKLPVLPFLCVKVGRFGFYGGWKVYGFDSPEYINYPGIVATDIYDGSLALEFTARIFSDG